MPRRLPYDLSSNCHTSWRSRLLVAVVALVFWAQAAHAEDYQNGFPVDSSFFPIGVWLQSPALASAYKAIGVNTYVGLWKGPTEQQLAALSRAGMFVIAAQNRVALQSPYARIVKGWLHEDEPDNAQPIGMGLYGTCIPATEIVRRTEEMKARDPTRPVMINFGQGIANPYWRGRGPCTGDAGYYSKASQDVDILSFDIYPVGSDSPQVKGKLEYVAHGVSRLLGLADKNQTVWAVLGTTALDPDDPVTPADIRAELWMAIIHGARGIVYFVHEFAPVFRADAIFRHPTVVREVTKEDRLIQSLAPVLNSPSLTGLVSLESASPIAIMVKRSNNTLYIFSVAMSDVPSRASVALEGISAADATVVDEDREIAISDGRFTDYFEGYGVHIYRIPLNPAGAGRAE